MTAPPLSLSLPDEARCLGCGYALRGLSTHRCPECARAFNPADPWTMSVGRPMPWVVSMLTSPMSPFIRTGVIVGSSAILWGAAWLPGGRYVELLGWVMLSLAVAYTLPRRGIRTILRRRYAQPLRSRPESEKYRPWQLGLVFLAITSPFFFWPLRVSLFIHRPLLDRFARDAHDVRPLFDPPRTPRFVGALVLTEVRVSPNYVTLEVLGNGALHWSPDGPRTWNHWLAASNLPWWYRWVARPVSGHWIAEPLDSRF
jgi:hypothetical protein